MKDELRYLLQRLRVASNMAAAESFDHGHEKQGVWFRDASQAAERAIEAIEQDLSLSRIREAMEMPRSQGEALDRGKGGL